METFDVRIAAIEPSPVTLTAVSGTIAPNAALGYGPHLHVATTDVTLAEPTGGSNGQRIEVWVLASGADRVLTVAGSAITIPAGTYWWGHYIYDAPRTAWILDDSGGGGGGGGVPYTDEQVRDVIGATLVQGPNVTITPDDAANTITISAAGYAASVHAVGNSGAALTLDASAAAGYIKTITLTANCTFTLTGTTAGQATTLELVLTQDATGSRTVTWPASVKWSGGAPILSTAAGATDRVVLTSYNNGTTWYADLVGKGYG